MLCFPSFAGLRPRKQLVEREHQGNPRQKVKQILLGLKEPPSVVRPFQAPCQSEHDNFQRHKSNHTDSNTRAPRKVHLLQCLTSEVDWPPKQSNPKK